MRETRKTKMKKLLILAAVIVAGVAANAASFKWSASGVTGYDTTDLYSGSATLYAYLSTADSSTAKAVSTATMSGGAIAAGDTVFSSDDFTVGSTYTFYYTMEDAAGNVFTSGTKNSRAQATSTMTVAFAATGSWTAVPEPTCGLLMLLGMAGLALRRKRA